MLSDKVKDARLVTKGCASALVGVLAYCLVVAPILKQGSYVDITKETFLTIGLGFGLCIIFIGVFWVGIIKWKEQRL